MTLQDLKRGGVLNIVRRKVELRCPADNIPEDITIDLAGSDIGTSIKISSVKLPRKCRPSHYRQRLCNSNCSCTNNYKRARKTSGR